MNKTGKKEIHSDTVSTDAEKTESSLTDNPYDYCKLGVSLMSKLSDEKKGVELIKKAIELAAESEVLCDLYEIVQMADVSNDCLGTQDDLLTEIEEKALEEACCTEDYLLIAACINDKALDDAYLAANSSYDYLAIAEYLKYDGNPSKAKKYYQKALDEADTEAPEEIAKIKEAIQ